MRRKNKNGNRILLLLLFLMTVVMLLLTGWIRGWFDHPEAGEPRILASQGSVYLKRRNIAFCPGDQIRLRRGDSLLTGEDASAEVVLGEIDLKLRPDSEITIAEEKEKPKLILIRGSAFLDTGKDSLVLEAAGEAAELYGGAACFTLEEEGPVINLFSGSCDREDLTENADLQEISSETLKNLNEISLKEELCWSRRELFEETADRERSRQKELQKRLEEETDYSDNALVCSIEIRCDSVLKHPDQLMQDKKPYIPEDGEILKKISVNFEEGDTVLNVLERVCTAGEIPLEYNFTPAYKSYYIEGINHLYEFDCGPASGWTYTVNGQYPNYGCSSCILNDGDEIQWLYTCDYSGSMGEAASE